MNDKEKQFYLHKHYAVDIKPTISKPKNKVSVWKLVFIQNNQTVIHGEFSLCKWKLNQILFSERKKYKIIPF